MTQTRGWVALEYEIMAEFDAAGSEATQDRESYREACLASRADREREADRKRKAESRARLLARLREIEGYGERTCPTCGCMFPVRLGAVGRPQVHCCDRCRWISAVRAWRKRLRSIL